MITTKILGQPFINSSTVREVRTGSRRDSSRITSSVHISSRNNGDSFTEWVVGAGSRRDTSRPPSGLSLANVVSLLLLPDKLGVPPLCGSRRSRNKTGNVSRGNRYRSLSLTNVVSLLLLPDKLVIPPLGSSCRSRNKTGNISRG